MTKTLGECEEYKFPSKKEYLKIKQDIIKDNFKIDTIFKNELNFLDKVILLFKKKEIIVKDFGFGYKPKLIIKKLNNKNILINYIEGSTKELL